MKLNEDFMVLPADNPSEQPDHFKLQITKEDCPFDQWVFLIKGIRVPSEEETGALSDDDELVINLDYDVISPDTVTEEYLAENNDEIGEVIGPCILDIVMSAIENQKLIIEGDE